jgi:hypothetical protein
VIFSQSKPLRTRKDKEISNGLSSKTQEWEILMYQIRGGEGLTSARWQILFFFSSPWAFTTFFHEDVSTSSIQGFKC